MGKIIPLRFRLESVSPQREQYKPYAYSLVSDNVYVEIDVSADVVVDKDNSGDVVLNLEGFKVILSSLANAVEEVHEAHIVKARKLGKVV